jgi:hypothetical protein
MKNNVARRWVNALRSGKYKKTTGVLKRSNGSYCALGVLCDLYKKEGKPLGEKPSKDPKDYFSTRMDVVSFGGEVEAPPIKVLKWAGLGGREADEIAAMNDLGKSFKRIAAYVEKNKEIL